MNYNYIVCVKYLLLSNYVSMSTYNMLQHIMVLLLLITRWGSAELCAGHVTVLTQLVRCYILYHSLVDIPLRQILLSSILAFPESPENTL